jgi:hypothetical protein
MRLAPIGVIHILPEDHLLGLNLPDLAVEQLCPRSDDVGHIVASENEGQNAARCLDDPLDFQFFDHHSRQAGRAGPGRSFLFFFETLEE